MIWPLSVEKYHEMIDAGILTTNDPVELLDGCLVRKMPKNPLHRYMTELMRERLTQSLPAGYFTESQEPVTLSTSEPEPDITVIRGQRIHFLERHPHPREVALLVEVAEASLAYDRRHKKRIYARAGIVQYWIVNLIDRQIEVFRDPDAGTGEYRDQIIYGINDELPVVINGQAIGTLRLADLWPAK